MNRRSKNKTATFGLAAWLWVGLLVPGAMFSEEAGEQAEYRFEPYTYRAPTITLQEAVRLTLEHSPAIEAQRKETERQLGRAQQATGVFDPAFVLSSEYLHLRGEVTGGVLVEQNRQRNFIFGTSEALDGIADSLEEQLAARGEGPIFAECPPDVDQIFVNDEPVCVTEEQIRAELALRDLLEALSNLGEDGNPSGSDVEAIIERFDEGVRDLIRDQARGLREAVARERNAFANFGELPEIEERNIFNFDLSYRIPTRSSLVFVPRIFFESTEDKFEGKARRTALGGKGLPNEYTAAVGMAIEMPLGRGRGRRATTAPERAGKLNYEASLDQYRHAVTATVAQTLLAYWNLVAAQETLTVLEGSVAKEDRIYSLSQQLVEGDVISGAELRRSRARLANARGTARSAQQSVIDARIDLALAIGLEVNSMADAPLAADAFPDIAAQEDFDAVDTDGLLHRALAQRLDIEAAIKRQQVAEILLEASELDLRRRYDLSFAFGYAGYEEDSNFREGFEGAFFGKQTGPSALLSLDVSWPVKNDTAEGRVVQSEASYQSSVITQTDLQRVTRSNIVDVVSSMRQTAFDIEKRREALGYYQETIDNSFYLFETGELSLIDTISTEELVIGTDLALIRSKSLYASLLTQLRFELGELLVFSGGGAPALAPGYGALPAASAVGAQDAPSAEEEKLLAQLRTQLGG